MGALIHLAAPAPAGVNSASIAYSVGRALTATDFAQQSSYVDARLLELAPATPGVISGLGITPATYSSPNPTTTGLASFTIGPGSAIGNDGRLVRLTIPMTVSWANLVTALTTTATATTVTTPGPAVTTPAPALTTPTTLASAAISAGALTPGPTTPALATPAPVVTTPAPAVTTSTPAVTTATPVLTRPVTLTTISPVVSSAALSAATAAATAELADGAYLLLVRTAMFDGLDGPPPDPALRASPDPLLDIHQDAFVEVWLSASLGSLPATLDAGHLYLALNQLVGQLTDTTLDAAVGNGAPIALILVRSQRAILLSQAAGRLPSGPSGLRAMLLAQVREAFGAALAVAGANVAAVAWQVATRAWFQYLPGAGELPLGLLLNPALVTASCPFFPTGTAVYLRAIRASQATHFLYQALGRTPIDLTSNTAEAVTLAMAVPDADWAPNLLDIPRADPVLAADLHLAYARARAAQVALRQTWNAVYGGMTVIASEAQAVLFLAGSDAAAQDLYALLNAPAGTGIGPQDLLTAANEAASPAALLGWVAARFAAMTALGAALPSPLPASDATAASASLASLGYQVADTEPGNPATVPTSSDTVLAPLFPSLPANSTLASWTAAISAASPNPALLQPLIDAGIIDPNATRAVQQAAITTLLALPVTDDTQPGALFSLAVLQLFYAVLVRVTRNHEQVLDAHGRLIALQRQHLDIMSTAVSSLAGGVPADGSGLSFARIIPFFSLVPPPPTTTPPPTTPPPTTAAPASTTAPPAVDLRTTATEDELASRTLEEDTLAETEARATLATQPVVQRAPIFNTNLAAPAASKSASLLGNGTDIAKSVALDVGALQQSPTYSYTPVQYGTASAITPAVNVQQAAIEGVTALRSFVTGPPINLKTTITIPAAATATDPNSDVTSDQSALAYTNIVQTTRALLSDITLVENNAILIERAYLLLRDRVQSLQTVITQVTNTLATARDNFRAAQAAATKAAGDYAAAQQLVLEEVARVTAAIASRNAAIGAATGLFYARELQTVIAHQLPPSLGLIADATGDVAPGCPTGHPGPPAAIQPFLDLLLEVPLSNWAPLQGRWTDLPDSPGLLRLGTLRTARVANFALSSNFGSGAAAANLATMAKTTSSVFDPVFRGTIPIGPSLAVNQQAAFMVLSPPDLVTLPPSLLRTNSDALRANLESAAGCLFETLMALPASLRFGWSTLAIANNLPALTFSSWPLPTGMGTAGATGLRQLAALVNWMAAQLQDGSSAAAQTALGNLVLAAVVASAYGDPNEAVTGTVQSTGGVPRPGVPIRVNLNRVPPIGTVLNLLDANQSIIGTIRVQDNDALGTTATVVSSFTTSAPTAGWTIATPGGRAPWLPS